MKKIILILLSMIALCNYTHAADKLVFANEPTYPPFEMLKADGSFDGLDIEIAKEICKELNVECEFVSQTFDSLIAGLKQKRFNAVISAMDITPERKKQVAFSIPYYDSSASFIVVSDKIKDMKDIKKVGVQNGTTFQQYVTKHHPELQKKAYASLQKAIADLQIGRIDAIFGDTAVLAEWKKEDKKLAFIHKVTDAEFFGIGLGIAVRQEDQELLNKINAALEKIKASPKYNELLQKWIN